MNPSTAARAYSCGRALLLLAGDLVAKSGVSGLDFACPRQHVVDLAVRDHDSAGGVGEHVLAGHHPYAVEDHWHVGLKRRHTIASPARCLTRAVGGEVVAGKL